MAVTENIYLGKDNEIALILKNDSTAIDLSSVTRMTLKLGRVLISSTNGGSEPILWNESSYATGEVHIKLRGMSSVIECGLYTAPLMVYDPVSTAGVMWGNVRVRVWDNPEST